MNDPVNDPERRIWDNPRRKERVARRQAQRKAKAAQIKRDRKVTYRQPCVRCGIPGPGRYVAGKIRVCRICWNGLTKLERANIRDSAHDLG